MNIIKNVSESSWASYLCLCLLLFFISTHSAAQQEEEDEPEAANPDEKPLIELSRTGHLDVMADKRTLSWQTTEPEAMDSIEVRVVKVEMGSMEAEELYSSARQSGSVDVQEFDKGPGLYALLAKGKSVKGETFETGIRLSYSALNPDCPDQRAWWPRALEGANERTADERAEQPFGYNLLGLVSKSSYVVTATAADLIACPTKEGSLFTYVMFKNVKVLQQETGARQLSEELFLRIPGGMAHGRIEVVTDAPVFKQQDQVMLFLTRDLQQQVPIVDGTDGVFFIENNGIRTYGGPMLTGIDQDYVLELDPGYKPDPKHARHWDPNMRAVWRSPGRSEPLGNVSAKDTRTREPLSMDGFAEQLNKTWEVADSIGRVPQNREAGGRKPYNELPQFSDSREQTAK